MSIPHRAIMESFMEEVVSVLAMRQSGNTDLNQACEGHLIQSPPSPYKEQGPEEVLDASPRLPSLGEQVDFVRGLQLLPGGRWAGSGRRGIGRLRCQAKTALRISC